MTDNYTEPKPLFVTTEEGGDYIPWKEWTLDWAVVGERWGMTGGKYGFRIHSVGFDNGRVFDNCGGWRGWDPDHLTPDLRGRMGLEKPQCTCGAAEQIADVRRLLDAIRRIDEDS